MPAFVADNPIHIKRTVSSDPDFRLLTRELDTDLRARNGSLMDIYDEHNLVGEIDTALVAYYEGKPAGCGCFKKYDQDMAEIKRMFVRPEYRGKHIAYQLLDYLLGIAYRDHFHYAILETGTRQIEALRLYERSGFYRIPNYAPYEFMSDSICFSKMLYFETGSEESKLREAYKAFNSRNISQVLSFFDPAVSWPNGWEGGYIKGHTAVKSYWQRQWSELDPEVNPVRFKRLDDGRLQVLVHQHVENSSGVLLFSGLVYHTYTFSDGLVMHMEINEAPQPV